MPDTLPHENARAKNTLYAGKGTGSEWERILRDVSSILGRSQVCDSLSGVDSVLAGHGHVRHS